MGAWGNAPVAARSGALPQAPKRKRLRDTGPCTPLSKQRNQYIRYERNRRATNVAFSQPFRLHITGDRVWLCGQIFGKRAGIGSTELPAVTRRN
jgi:hypothetical protein